VAGGLGQYLGVDSTVLRIGFVIASLVFLGGFGGPILYIIAWVLLPEEGKDSPVNRATFSGRPWHDWDRSARSWALVLGALALALIWSFGVWPWWHWRVLPFWLVALGVGLWLLARHRETGWASAQPPWDRPAAPGSGPAPGAGPGPGSGPGGSNGPTAPVPDSPGPVVAEPVAPVPGSPSSYTTGAATSVTTVTAPVTGGEDVVGPLDPSAPPEAAVAATIGPVGTSADVNGTSVGSASTDSIPRGPLSAETVGATLSALPGAGTSTKPADPTQADWAVAQSAAADWAASQLALAGVPAVPGSANDKSTAQIAPATTSRPLPSSVVRSMRRAVRVLVALVIALVLLAVVTVVGVVLGTGSSLSGGAGDSSYTPSAVGDVQPNYHLGAGRLVLDLSSVEFPASGKAVDVTVGIGNLIVDVPRDAVVTVDARSGIGQVDVFGQTGSSIEATYDGGTATPGGAPHLDLDAHVGIGQLQVTRG
jgi:phage shock protein PspC (stress-responsive transcriptional regulator)